MSVSDTCVNIEKYDELRKSFILKDWERSQVWLV